MNEPSEAEASITNGPFGYRRAASQEWIAALEQRGPNDNEPPTVTILWPVPSLTLRVTNTFATSDVSQGPRKDCHHEGHEDQEERIRRFVQSRNRSAIEVHLHLGPGLLESAYKQLLAHELSRNKIAFQLQLELPVRYKDVLLDHGYRIDVLVNGQLIIELRSVEKLLGIHEAQLLTYMKLAGINTGLLMDFNATKLKDGMKRPVL